LWEQDTEEYTKISPHDAHPRWGFPIDGVVADMIQKVVMAMPYLKPYPVWMPHQMTNYPDRYGAARAIAFIQDGQEFPSGYFEFNGRAKWSVFSPGFAGTKNGFRYTTDVDRAYTLCKQAFKVTPPPKVANFVAMTKVCDDTGLTREVRDKHVDCNRARAGFMEYGSSSDSKNAGAEVYDILRHLHNNGHKFRSKLNAEFAALDSEQAWFDENQKDQLCWMYIRMCPNERVRFGFKYGQEDAMKHHGCNAYHSPQYDTLSDMYQCRMQDLPESILVKLSQLAIDDNEVYVEHVGAKINQLEFMVFSHGEEVRLDINRGKEDGQVS
jgi:hypothetical protein